MKKHDVIIIGGGPGGSHLAALLALKKFDVAVIERENYPRFHIGESLLPASMPLFKETGFYETLASGKYIQKYGARFPDYKTDDEIYFGFQDGFNQDIPSAFEVLRSEFDKDILNHARKVGATVYQPERVKTVDFSGEQARVTTNQNEYECRFVIDATGRESFLGKQLKLRTPHKDLNNVAVFAHFTGVKRYEGINEGDITIGMLPDAAWTWVIPFKGEHTSVGVVCNSSVFKGGTDLAEYLDSRFQESPRLRNLLGSAERISEVSVISNYSHRCETYSGERWMLVGDAAVFLDPIFSSGVHVAVTSATFAAQAIERAFEKNISFKDEDLGLRYKADLDRGVARFHSLISLFYKTDFVQGMKKTLGLEKTRQFFTSAVAGDMWNDENFIFQMKVL